MSGNAYLRSLYIVYIVNIFQHINIAQFPFNNKFMLLDCFYTQQLLSTPTYSHKWRLENQEVFSRQKF